MKKKGWFIGLSLMVIVLLLFGMYKLMNARTFQMFGGLTNQIETKENVVAITFDDGPTKNIEKILPLLERYNAKATFFVIGSELEQNMELGINITEAGHQMGNHTYSHQRMIFKSQSFIEAEIDNTNTLIRETGFKGEIDFRPPNGKKLFALPYYLHKHGIETITWNLEPDTYYSSITDKVHYVTEHVVPGSIILLHPMYDDKEIEVLEQILKSLSEKGYKFLTVNEMQQL